MRAFMWEIAGDDAGVEWAGTFVWVLLPGTIIGALLAWAEHRRWTGSLPHARWLVWSPMLFAGVLFQNPLDLLSGFEGGIGLAAVAVPTMCMLGGYAIAGRGPLWVRGLFGLVTLSALPIWSLTATDVGGSGFSLGDPHGLWAAILYWGLLATFCMAAALPHRRPVPPFDRTKLTGRAAGPATAHGAPCHPDASQWRLCPHVVPRQSAGQCRDPDRYPGPPPSS